MLARAFGPLALLIGSLVLVFAGAELVARLTWRPAIPPQRPPRPEAWRDLPELRSVHALGMPNVRGINAGALFETNSAGFRGPERPRDKPPGIFRIAILGDSLAMGWGVPEEDTYAARVERALRPRPPATRIEVLNLALAGQDATAAVARLHDLGLDFDPDLVVYGFTVNDLENEHYRRTSVSLADVARGVHTNQIFLWRALAPRIGPWREVLFAPPGTYLRELDENYFENPEAWDLAVGALDRLAETARERDLCAVLLLHARLHFLNRLHPYHRHYDAVAEAASARGLFVVPTVQAFLGRKDRDLWVRPDDAHPGPEAHGIFAAELLSGLEALPARCWRRDR